MKKSPIFIRMRSEIAAGTRGSSFGPLALEWAAIKDGSKIFDQHKIIDLKDQNEFLYSDIDTPNAIRIEGLVEVYKELSRAVANTLKTNENFPIVISGDHANAGGTIAGIKKAFPNKKIGVVWVDAHGDLHTPYTTPSGNVHGMPVALSLGFDNIENQINTLSDKELRHWEELKNIGGIQPKIQPEDVVFFSVRSTEAPEDNLAKEHGIKNYGVAELRYRGLGVCLKEAELKLKDCDLIYISFDVDSMDCDLISYGTGTPVQKGLDQEEATAIIQHFMNLKKTACLEFVEINPLLDNKGNRMAETAYEVLKELLD